MDASKNTSGTKIKIEDLDFLVEEKQTEKVVGGRKRKVNITTNVDEDKVGGFLILDVPTDIKFL